MQAIILAAGLGQRMQPLTATTPKPLLLLRGKPLIVHLLQALKMHGISKVVINVFHLKEQIQDFLQDGAQYGIEIKYSIEEQLLDTGGGIVRALPLLANEPFIVASADVYSDYNFSLLPSALKNLAHLVLVANPPFNSKGDFSLTDQLVTLVGNNTLTYAGFGMFTKEFFENPPTTIFPLSYLLNRAINNQQVTGEIFTGQWHNIGTTKLLATAEQTLCQTQ